MANQRIAFASNPTVFHPTGLKLKNSECPCPKQIIEELLKDLMHTYNPPGSHQCTSLCGQVTQLLIGCPHTEDLKSSVSELFEEKLQLFEELVTCYLDDGECWYKERMEVCTIAIRFLPCVKYMEVIDAAIYLV